MNQLWNLVKKECRELLTPSTILSVVAVCVILIILGSVIGGEVTKNTGIKAVGVIDDTTEPETEITYSDWGITYLETYYDSKEVESSEYVKIGKNINLDDKDAILNFMKENHVDTCVLIPKTYNTDIKNYVDSTDPNAQPPVLTVYYNQESTSAFSSLSTVTGVTAVSYITKGVTEKLLYDGGTPAEKIEKILAPSSSSSRTFFNGDMYKNTTPADITSAISAQTMYVPIIIMLIIVMIGSILISSMGNEKENKTLETLLTLPISRTTVVAGKLLGCAIAGLVMGAIYMVGMYFYISSFASAASTGKSLQDLGLVLSVGDWLIVALFVFLAIMCALGMCMILGAFAKNYKAAQTYVMPISVLAVIPMFVTMFTSYTTLPAVVQGILFLIPFTHPMMILQNLMFGNWTIIIAGAIYLVIFAAAMIYITVRLYNSDILLTGWLKKDDGKKKSFSWSDIFKKSKN